MKTNVNGNKGVVKAFCIILLFIGLQRTQAQEKTRLPNFRIALTDSSYFNGEKLKKGKAVLFIYFLPDCEDCRDFISALIPRMRSFKNKQIVMITNAPLNQVVKIEKEFKLRSFKNLIVGTEGRTGDFQRSFSIERFPFAAAYNKNGRLIQEFNNQITNQVMIRQLINLCK